MRFCFIAEPQHRYPARVLCGVMNVSRSGFYGYLARIHREPSARERTDASLLERISVIFEESNRRYGSPRIHAELRKRRVVCSLKRVKRLMRQAGIRALLGRKSKHRKTPEGSLETANPLVAKPEIVTVNQVWYSDTTFIETAEGWLYLAAVMDAYPKRIIGHAMADHMRTDLVIRALRMGTRQRRISKGPIHHSDKGCQYTSYAYGRELAAWGMLPSFTGTGACLDNAYIESFFATLKKELVHQTTFATREVARLAVLRFTEGYYNRWRLLSSLDYRSPAEFETQAVQRLAA